MHLFHRAREMATFCKKPFALPHSYEIGQLEWVASFFKKSATELLWRSQHSLTRLDHHCDHQHVYPFNHFRNLRVSLWNSALSLRHNAYTSNNWRWISTGETSFAHESRNKLRSSRDRMFIVAATVDTSTYPLKRICWTDRVLFHLLPLLKVLRPTDIQNAELRQNWWLGNTYYWLWQLDKTQTTNKKEKSHFVWTDHLKKYMK
jgi:hypothetical protein